MTLEQQAFDMGREHGVNVGSWVIDGNTSDEAKRALIQGYEDGDPEVLDQYEAPNPLSGEWAGDPTPSDVYRALGVDDGDSATISPYDHLLDSYELGFNQGYWAEVIRSASATLEES